MTIVNLNQQIISNFEKQEQLYLTIADLSAQQLGILENDSWLSKPEQLNDLLEKRRNIIKKIDELNGYNKSLQKEVVQQLDIADYVLGALKSRLEAEQYKNLNQIVVRLGDLLANITQMDEQSHSIIKRKTGINKASVRTSGQKVKNAYQEAMQQAKKPQ